MLSTRLVGLTSSSSPGFRILHQPLGLWRVEFRKSAANPTAFHVKLLTNFWFCNPSRSAGWKTRTHGNVQHRSSRTTTVNTIRKGSSGQPTGRDWVGMTSNMTVSYHPTLCPTLSHFVPLCPTQWFITVFWDQDASSQQRGGNCRASRQAVQVGNLHRARAVFACQLETRLIAMQLLEIHLCYKKVDIYNDLKLHHVALTTGKGFRSTTPAIWLLVVSLVISSSFLRNPRTSSSNIVSCVLIQLCTGWKLIHTKSCCHLDAREVLVWTRRMARWICSLATFFINCFPEPYCWIFYCSKNITKHLLILSDKSGRIVIHYFLLPYT